MEFTARTSAGLPSTIMNGGTSRVTMAPAATTALTEDLVQRLKDTGLDQMALSLDFPRPELHDAFRGVPGAFAKTVDGDQLISVPMMLWKLVPLVVLILESLVTPQGIGLGNYAALNTNPRGSATFIAPTTAMRNSLVFAAATVALAVALLRELVRARATPLRGLTLEQMAAALRADCLVLVVGGLPPGSRDIARLQLIERQRRGEVDNRPARILWRHDARAR